MCKSIFFDHLQEDDMDPVVEVMKSYALDQHPKKIDVGIGIYKSENGDPNYVFSCVKVAKSKLASCDPGHCYTQTSGISEFLELARRAIFGEEKKDVASVQTISGTGAVHMALSFLQREGFTEFHVGIPSWANYHPMVKYVGGNFIPYQYYDCKSHFVQFEKAIEALEFSKPKSVFIFQAVCHNPTGSDYTKSQWTQILELVKKKGVFPLFDVAYQGFASGSIDEDAWVLREAYKLNLEFIVCQSYSKNMGLYSERVGCAHIRSLDKSKIDAITSKMISIIRREVSFTPAFGARVATIVQSEQDIRKIWAEDVQNVTRRLKRVREHVLKNLTSLKTPGYWKHVVEQNGLFWYSGLTSLQVRKLIEEYHIYGPSTGRVNVAGLNRSNIDYYCSAIDDIVRKYPK